MKPNLQGRAAASRCHPSVSPKGRAGGDCESERALKEKVWNTSVGGNRNSGETASYQGA